MDNGGSSSDVDSVIITGDLDRRPSRPADHEAEARALTALAEAMRTNPDTVLQRLVEMAMELTHSDSAGISLLEPGGEQGTFRWVATAGAWSPYRDGTMPREASPCGEVIAREAILLMKNPERSFPALLQAEPGISEGLLAPFQLGGVPIGTVWTIKHDPGDHFEAEDARLVKSLARFASAAHKTVQALRSADAAGQRAELRFQQLVALADVSSEFFGTCDMDLMPIYGNAAAMRMVGLADLEQVKRTSLPEFFFPEDRAFITDEFIPRVLREGQAKVEIRFRHFVTGEPVWVDYSLVVLKDEMGRPTGLGTVTHDLSERKRAETALRESEARFRQFSDASTNILWIRDAKTLRMEFASPAFDTIYGLPGPDRGGDGSLRSWARLIEPENRKSVLANFRRVRAGERIEHEFRIKRAASGALRWIHNTDFPLRDAAGNVRWIAGLGADITFVKEATGRQSVLVAELQHRTRNLIAVVRSLSDRTLGNAASLEDFGTRFRLRLSALSRVQGLLSHLTVGERVTFKELLCSELAAHGATDGMAHKIALDGPDDVPLRSATVQTFALALHELATNAAKYGALAFPDGHLFVSWHVEPASGANPALLNVEWRESGVSMPDIGAPARGGGYGRELIERALPYQLKAKTTFEMGSDGVRCTIVVPMAGAE